MDTHDPAGPRGDPGIPMLDRLLGFGPVLIFPLAAIVAWFGPPPLQSALIVVAQISGGVILLFLAGVRRGLSFFTEDGPRAAQLGTTIWLFLIGLAGLLLPPVAAFAALIAGYASVALLDPRAARGGEVPAHFARLRPPQMAVAVLGLAGVLARLLVV